MFLSSYEGNIDAKGRVLVPAPIRAALGERQRLFLWPSLDGGGYLEGGGEELLEHYKKILMRMAPRDPNRIAFANTIFGKNAPLSMDQGGRTNLPEAHLKSAGITNKVLFVGMLDHIQVWDPARYAEYDARMTAHAANNQDKLEAPFMDGLAAGTFDSGSGGKS